MVQIPLRTQAAGMLAERRGRGQLVIDTGRMAYIACSKQGISSGTVAETDDGQGSVLKSCV